MELVTVEHESSSVIKTPDYLRKRDLLRRSIDITHNRWWHIDMNEMYRSLLSLFREKESLPIWEFLLEERDKSDYKAIEMTHLMRLLTFIPEESLVPYANELQKRMPFVGNQVQPMYDPYSDEELQPLLRVEMNEGSNLILYSDGSFSEISLEGNILS